MCLFWGDGISETYAYPYKVMLIANLAVDQRFANGIRGLGQILNGCLQSVCTWYPVSLGTQGRLLQWHPAETESKRRALPAYCPDLLARFCKESSLGKQEMLPDIDHMDIGARQETLAVRGEPVMLQLCVIPAYALTIHKTQALSIKHLVVGCLEGVSGRRYVTPPSGVRHHGATAARIYMGFESQAN